MLYVPSKDHDTLLEAWFHVLRTTGDLDKLYLLEQRHLSFFLASFRRPVELVFEMDRTPQIIRALSFDPSPAVGAWVMLWVHPSHRASRASLRFLIETYQAALEVWPILYGLTWQPDLLEPHRQLGYTVGAEIPSAFDGHCGWLVCLTRANFLRSPAYGRYERSQRQSREPATREHQPADL